MIMVTAAAIMSLKTRGCCFQYAMFLPLLLILGSLQPGRLETTADVQVDKELQLTITSNPEGPIYPIGSWLRLACRAENLSYDYTYQWIGLCSKTGDVQLVVDQPLLDEDYYAEFWLFTSPKECLDLAVCNVVDWSTFEVVANASLFIGNITGVGLSIENHFNPGFELDNTSLILAPTDCHNMETPTILCHSSSKSQATNNASYWIDPHGNIISTSNASEQSPEAFTAVGLTLCRESPGNSLSEGVYTCVGVNENGQAASTYLGVYFDKDQDVQTKMNFRISNDDTLYLEFSVQGIPSTTTQWTKDTILLNRDTNKKFSFHQTILNTSEAVYTNELVIEGFTQYAVNRSSFRCDVYMVKSEVDLFGLIDEEQKFASGQFILATLGDTTIIDCSFSKAVTGIQWLGTLPQGSDIIYSSSSNRISLSIDVGTDHHGQRLTCRGTDASGESVDISFVIIVHIPLSVEVITPAIEDPNQSPTVGLPYTLKCCASIGNTTEGDIFDGLLLEWIHHFENGPVVTVETRNLRSNHRNRRRRERPCIRLNFDPLIESDKGVYECRSTLTASQLQVVRTVHYDLQVLPRNVIATGPEQTDSASTRDMILLKTKTTTTSFDAKTEFDNSANDQNVNDRVFTLSVTLATSFGFVVLMVIALMILGLAIHLMVLKNRRRRMDKEVEANKKESDDHTDARVSNDKVEKPPILSDPVMSNGAKSPA